MKNNISWLLAAIVAFVVYKILSKGILWTIVAFLVTYMIGYNIGGLIPPASSTNEDDDLKLLNETK